MPGNLIWFVLGGLSLYLIYLMTKDNKPEQPRVDPFEDIRRRLIYLEGYKESTDVNLKTIFKAQNDQKDFMSALHRDVKRYAHETDIYRQDHIQLSMYATQIERQQADLVPVHRHYYLSDEMIKIKRVTNERHGRTETPVHSAGNTSSGNTFEPSQADDTPKANPVRREEAKPAIPSYSPPGPGAFGFSKT